KINIKLTKVDEKILNVFDNSYHISWVKDHIMPSSMKRLNIKLDTLEQRIIIPTRSHVGDLVGIRVRNLKQELVDKGFKYLPMKRTGMLYNFSMWYVLYGIYVYKQNINTVKELIIF